MYKYTKRKNIITINLFFQYTAYIAFFYKKKKKKLSRKYKMGDNEYEHEVRKMIVVGEKYCYNEEIELTVHKKSMFRQGDGFIVYDPNGDIIFRVDLYSPMKPLGLVLMDTFGKPLLTLLHKRPTLHHRLEGFLGETSDGQQSILSIWKSMMIGQSKMMVELYHESSPDVPIEYQIEGSYNERSCTIFRMQHDTSSVHVAQIKRKVEPTRNMVLSRDVFSLIVQPGVDAAFVMGLVLALDKIDGDDVALAPSGG
ncbi:protein LURP-one-related 12-like [Silene latifolia]|uniref:protein LURP-one-related 12-like n=1 Tax=Silene latifolia TaxID=37657 RepID=UPI003D783C00